MCTNASNDAINDEETDIFLMKVWQNELRREKQEWLWCQIVIGELTEATEQEPIVYKS